MKKIIKRKNLTWIDIVKPDESDIEYLIKNFKIDSLTAKTIIPSIHYPDLDSFKNYLFIILHYPHCGENNEIKIREFDIVAGKNFLITSRYDEIAPLRSVFTEWEKPNAVAEKETGYLLFLVLNTFLKDVLEKVNGIAAEIDEVEEKIFTGKEQELIREITALKMRIIDLWRIVEPQRMIFDSLRSAGTQFFGTEYRHYYSILFRMHRRIENSLKNAKETVEALEETSHFLVSLKMNEIIKILTLSSVIFLPLTLLASIWGMNTNFLPFQKSGYDFFLVILIMTATFGGMFAIFKHKKWI
jgi:magnesium transporter